MRRAVKANSILIVVAVLILLWDSIGQTEEIDTTTSWDGSSFAVGNFGFPLLLGQPNFATVGQTFTVGEDNVLQSFTLLAE